MLAEILTWGIAIFSYLGVFCVGYFIGRIENEDDMKRIERVLNEQYTGEDFGRRVGRINRGR